MTAADLPTLNACLNTVSAVLLALGYVNIRRGRIARHRRFMLAALLSSTLFLCSYLTYHLSLIHISEPTRPY